MTAFLMKLVISILLVLGQLQYKSVDAASFRGADDPNESSPLSSSSVHQKAVIIQRVLRPPTVCGDGKVQREEECEDNADCPSGGTCSVDCVCFVGGDTGGGDTTGGFCPDGTP